MLKLFVFSVILCFSSCLGKPMEPEYKAKQDTPTPLPSATKIEVAEDSAPASKEYNEAFFKDVGAKLVKKSTSFGLKPLSGVSVGKDSKELRFYVFPVSTGPLYKGLTVEESVLVLKSDGTNWTGEAVRQVNKTDKPEKFAETLNAPKSGWDNLWQQLQNFDVLNATADDKDGFEKVQWLYVIETKANGKYHYGYFHAPKKTSANKAEQNFANIFSLIADEFNAPDLKAN